MKTCTKCKIEKDNSEFKRGKRCKECVRDYHRLYRKRNKDKVTKNRKAYEERCLNKDNSHVKEKICTECKESKTVDNFHRSRKKSDGYVSKCKNCVKERAAKHYQKNKERYAKNQKEYLINNRKKRQKWRQSYYQKNKDKERELSRLWEKNNKGARKAIKAKYRTTLEDAIPDNVDFSKIKEIYDNCPEGYEVDHVIPISRGGLHEPNNLQYLTREDNRSKGNKLMSEWKKNEK